MKKIVLLGLVVSSILALSACSKNRLTFGDWGVGGKGKHGANQNKFKLGPHRGLLGVRQYYFPCNSMALPDQYKAAVAAQAQYLKSHSGSALQLQGYADSAGSPEYNIGVGQQRAQSVYQYMTQQGARTPQVSVMSYGAETNALYSGNSVAANCRVDVVYTKD